MSRKTPGSLASRSRGKIKILPSCSTTMSRFEPSRASSSQSGRLNLRFGKATCRSRLGNASAAGAELGTNERKLETRQGNRALRKVIQGETYERARTELQTIF